MSGLTTAESLLACTELALRRLKLREDGLCPRLPGDPPHPEHYVCVCQRFRW